MKTPLSLESTTLFERAVAAMYNAEKVRGPESIRVNLEASERWLGLAKFARKVERDAAEQSQ